MVLALAILASALGFVVNVLPMLIAFSDPHLNENLLVNIIGLLSIHLFILFQF
jgi:hypothetical protein